MTAPRTPEQDRAAVEAQFPGWRVLYVKGLSYRFLAAKVPANTRSLTMFRHPTAVVGRTADRLRQRLVDAGAEPRCPNDRCGRLAWTVEHWRCQRCRADWPATAALPVPDLCSERRPGGQPQA